MMEFDMLRWATRWFQVMEQAEQAGRTVEQLVEAADALRKDQFTMPLFQVSKDEFVALLKADLVSFEPGAYRLNHAFVPVFAGTCLEVGP